MSVRIFWDCGAPSLYNELSKKDTASAKPPHIRHWHRDDFSYVDTPKFIAYRDALAEFMQREADNVDVFANLDVIHNAELTWKHQKWFEARGLRPTPIWHYGSDVKWLHRYLDEGYDYICIGGLVPNPRAVLRPALDRLWTDHLTDKDGFPLARYHSLGLTSFSLLTRYPWYSTDSKSWIDYARFGIILVPPLRSDGTFAWNNPARICMSNRSLGGRRAHSTYRMMSQRTRDLLHRYLEALELPIGSSKFVRVADDYKPKKKQELWHVKPGTGKPAEIEQIVKPGVSNNHGHRMSANAHLFQQLEQSVPEWPWAFRRGKQIKRGRLMSRPADRTKLSHSPMRDEPPDRLTIYLAGQATEAYHMPHRDLYEHVLFSNYQHCKRNFRWLKRRKREESANAG